MVGSHQEISMGHFLNQWCLQVQAHKATDSCDTNPRLLETCSNAPNGSEWFKVGPLSQKQVNMFIPVYWARIQLALCHYAHCKKSATNSRKIYNCHHQSCSTNGQFWSTDWAVDACLKLPYFLVQLLVLLARHGPEISQYWDNDQTLLSHIQPMCTKALADTLWLRKESHRPRPCGWCTWE